MLSHIIIPVAAECGYKAIRADEISEPGVITAQIIHHLLDDDMVVADLTGQNPNVYYELAVRHAVRKPVVQIIQAEEKIPFDVAGQRTIPVNHHDLDSVEQCHRELTKQIRASEKDPSIVDSPISVAIDLQVLRQSENPLEKSTAEIMDMLQALRAQITELQDRVTFPLVPSAKQLKEIEGIIDEIDTRVYELGDEPDPKTVEQTVEDLSILVSELQATVRSVRKPRRLTDMALRLIHESQEARERLERR